MKVFSHGKYQHHLPIEWAPGARPWLSWGPTLSLAKGRQTWQQTKGKRGWWGRYEGRILPAPWRTPCTFSATSLCWGKMKCRLRIRGSTKNWKRIWKGSKRLKGNHTEESFTIKGRCREHIFSTYSLQFLFAIFNREILQVLFLTFRVLAF